MNGCHGIGRTLTRRLRSSWPNKLRGEGYTVRVDKKKPDTWGGVVRPFSKVFVCRGSEAGCTKGCMTI